MKLDFREAEKNDISKLVKMFADDKLGAQREDASEPINERYIAAFNQIQNDPNNEIIVAIYKNEIVGMMQLTYIPSLNHTGSKRCIIGDVRVRSQYRGQGLGTKILNWGIKQSESIGCEMVQITSDKQRPEAIHFHEKLGFKATHEGLRLKLN